MKIQGEQAASDTAAQNSQSFERELIAGLSHSPKTIPCKFLYDAEGARLFDGICDLPEYYPTRTEMEILERNIREISACAGPERVLVELGSGSARKTRLLLDHLDAPLAYLPVDISEEQLTETSDALREDYPFLDVLPVRTDYTSEFDLPMLPARQQGTLFFFPGSTIGNFHPEEAGLFLGRIAESCRPDGALLIGVDLKKETGVIERAYNDAQGLTAAFNLNLLVRANRELGADFNPAQFQHRAVYNRARGRIEMRLVSLAAQSIQIGAQTFPFEQGEEIITEFSYKYELEQFQELAARAGFKPGTVWTDPKEWFGIFYLTASEG